MARAAGARTSPWKPDHAAQNVLLQAAALGLASVPVGAFRDAQVGKILGLAARERAVYLLPVGRESLTADVLAPRHVPLLRRAE